MRRLLVAGDKAPQFAAHTITGKAVSIPDTGARLVHLQFRRFAGCPVCNFHLATMARRHDEIARAGLQQIVLFHSAAEEMRKYQARLPFDCVADPEKRHYREWGVETSPTALLHPRVILNGARWVLMARRFYRRAENGILGLPADFLVDPAGTLLAVRYGEHADDQWSVDELMHLLPAAPIAASRRP